MTRRRAARAALILLATLVSARVTAQRAMPSKTQLAAPWVPGATCYEVFVRSFRDSDGDGIGDLKGLISALDYINDGNPRSTRSLGARCLWLMPIMETPGYHGYDVSDYYRVARVYGTNDDFKRLVAESHRRGIKVLVDMVINHTSSEYPPFQNALRDPASPYRSWFRFSPTRGPDNRWGNNNWHRSPVRDEYYYGFFWQGMPDLNYEGSEALNEMKKVASFWLNEMGADGFRLDAVRYLVEDGATVDDTPGTHAVLREYGAHVRQAKPGAFTIGEVFDSTGTLLAYYPDQLDAYFAFEVADSLIAGVQRGDARGILAPVLRLQGAVPAERWAPFLRNHDQPRTRTEFNGDWGKARTAALLLLTLPGLPFVYYGEELGMTGPKPDELIRTPMAWSRTAPHAGFTSGTPWQPLAADSLEANVEAQDGNARSLLNLHRTLIRLRTATPALGRGALIPLTTNNPAAVAFLRRDTTGTVLVMVNVGPATLKSVRVASADEAPRFRRLAPRTLYGLSRASTIRLDARRRLTATAHLPGHSGFVIALGDSGKASPP
ncbi:MAG: alpha-amylase [Gemmatimonas sp.]|nr:alpha-amylase [Gemmatimonas sp.]